MLRLSAGDELSVTERVQVRRALGFAARHRARALKENDHEER
jgi:hypothetical protein